MQQSLVFSLPVNEIIRKKNETTVECMRFEFYIIHRSSLEQSSCGRDFLGKWEEEKKRRLLL